MQVGPLRRLTGTIGLLALVPIAVMLATGAITPVDAAVRGIVAGVAVVVIGRVARVAVAHVANDFARTGNAGPTQHHPQRRRTDPGYEGDAQSTD